MRHFERAADCIGVIVFSLKTHDPIRMRYEGGARNLLAVWSIYLRKSFPMNQAQIDEGV